MKPKKSAIRGAINGAALTAAIALAAALALAFPAPGAAADAAKAKPAKAATKKTVASADEDMQRGLSGQAVYQVLLGEIALQRGNIDLALSAYADLAYRTRDARVLQRATDIASLARRYDVAYETSRLWVEVEPESMQARQMLAAVLVLQGRVDELGSQLAVLLEKDKENLSENLLRLNRMLARYQDKPAVYRMLEKVLIPAYDGIAEAHFALATAAYQAEERQRALIEIRKALALRPDWEAAALFESQLLARESASAAIESLEKFVKANPRSREVRLHLARGLIGEKRYAEARQHFDRLLADNPDSPELMYPVAVLALQQNDVVTAEPLLKKLLERGEPSEKAVAALYLGQLAEDRGAYAQAEGYYRQVPKGEQFAPAQIRVAQLLMKQGGSLLAAQAHLQASAKTYPAAGIQLTIAEAQLLRDAGRDEEALASLNKVLAQQPDQADILYDAAMLAEKLERMDLVETNLRRVIALKPDNAHAYNALGYSFADRGIRLDEARQLITQALTLAPEDPFILDSMGWVLFRQGDFRGALGYLQKAYVLKRDAEIAAHLGEVLWALDRREEAARTWAEAAQRHPDNAELKAVQKKFLP